MGLRPTRADRGSVIGSRKAGARRAADLDGLPRWTRLGRVSEVGRVVAWRRRRQHPSLTPGGSLRNRLDALGQLIELTGEVNWEPLSSGR